MRSDESWRSQLIPWDVAPQHRWAYPVVMLATEARRRDGDDVPDDLRVRLDRWVTKMLVDDTVVTYDPASAEGFHYVPRTSGDGDLVRPPKSV